MNNMGNYEVNPAGGLDLRIMSAEEWNATQAYLQSHGHGSRLFAALSALNEEDDDQDSSTAY